MIKIISTIKKHYFDNTVELSKLSKTFLLWAIGLGLVYVSNIYLIKLIGLNQYGKYTVFITWASLLSTILLFGWDGYLIQKIPQLKKNDDGKIINGSILYKAAITFLVLYCIAVAVSICIIWFKKDNSGFLQKDNLFFFLMLTFLFAVISILKAFLRVFNIISKVQWVEDILKPLALFAVIFFYYNRQLNLSLSTLYIMNCIAFCLVLILLGGYCIKTYNNNFEIRNAYKLNEKWLSKCFYFMCIFLGYTVFSKMELLFLGYFSNNEDAAKYQILLRISDLVILPDFLFNYFLPQKFAHHFANNRQEDAKHLFQNSSTTILLLQIGCFIGVSIIGYFYLQSFNIATADTYWLMVLLCVAPVFYSLFGSSNLVLKTSGNEKYSFYALLIVLPIEIVANYIFTQAYGLSAAVIISTASVLLYTFLLSYFAFLKLGLYNSVTRYMFLTWVAKKDKI